MVPAHALNRAFQRAESHVAYGGIDLGEAMFAAINAVLEANGCIMHGGTILDATIINAPSSTKNKEKARDPEMHQTKKGNEWRFGMKAHVGVDAGTGYVTAVTATAANEHDITQASAFSRSWHFSLPRSSSHNYGLCTTLFQTLQTVYYSAAAPSIKSDIGPWRSCADLRIQHILRISLCPAIFDDL